MCGVLKRPCRYTHYRNSSKKYKISRNENKRKWRLKQQQQQEKPAITKLTTSRTLILMHLNICGWVYPWQHPRASNMHTYKQSVSQAATTHLTAANFCKSNTNTPTCPKHTCFPTLFVAWQPCQLSWVLHCCLAAWLLGVCWLLAHHGCHGNIWADGMTGNNGSHAARYSANTPPNSRKNPTWVIAGCQRFSVCLASGWVVNSSRAVRVAWVATTSGAIGLSAYIQLCFGSKYLQASDLRCGEFSELCLRYGVSGEGECGAQVGRAPGIWKLLHCFQHHKVPDELGGSLRPGW